MENVFFFFSNLRWFFCNIIFVCVYGRVYCIKYDKILIMILVGGRELTIAKTCSILKCFETILNIYLPLIINKFLITIIIIFRLYLYGPAGAAASLEVTYVRNLWVSISGASGVVNSAVIIAKNISKAIAVSWLIMFNMLIICFMGQVRSLMYSVDELLALRYQCWL